MDNMENKEPPCKEYYDIEDKGNEWHYTCKVCGNRWALGKNYKAAEPLHLLNHAYSHKES